MQALGNRAQYTPSINIDAESFKTSIELLKPGMYVYRCIQGWCGLGCLEWHVGGSERGLTSLAGDKNHPKCSCYLHDTTAHIESTGTTRLSI